MCSNYAAQKDYGMKLKNIIDDGLKKGIYSLTVDTTLSKLKKKSRFSSPKFQK